MKKIIMLTIPALFLLLSGCALAAVWLDGCGSPDADLVVVNDSDWDVYSIVLEYGDSTETVQAASGDALLEPGQSYGLELEAGEGWLTLLDRAQRTIGRSRVTRREDCRQVLTFDGVSEGSLSLEERR